MNHGKKVHCPLAKRPFHYIETFLVYVNPIFAHSSNHSYSLKRHKFEDHSYSSYAKRVLLAVASDPRRGKKFYKLS